MLDRFPQHRGIIIELYGANDDFKAVCEDYWLCIHNVASLKEEEIADKRMLNQYSLLRLELESEAIRLISCFKKTLPA